MKNAADSRLLQENRALFMRGAMNNYGLYRIPATLEPDGFLRRADVLNERLKAARETHPDLWLTVLSKLRVDWTYNSTPSKAEP